MKLEDEIKQTKPFKNQFQKLVLNIAVTSSWLNTLLTERLKPYDITPHQYNVLRILKGKYPAAYCNQEITQRMIDKSSNATRIVDKLKEKKLIVRTENEIDRRLVSIKITEKGIKLLEEIDKKPFSEKIDHKNFNEEKAKLMNEWLDELRSLAENKA